MGLVAALVAAHPGGSSIWRSATCCPSLATLAPSVRMTPAEGPSKAQPGPSNGPGDRMEPTTEARVTSGSQLRRLAPSAPAIAVAVGLLTFGCTAPALTDRPVSESHTPEVVVTTATPDPTGPAHDYRAMQRQLRRELTEGAPDLKLVRSVLVSVTAGRPSHISTNGGRPTMRTSSRSPRV